MVKVEYSYITKKISRKTLPKLQRFKATAMMAGRKMTDMQAIDEALDAALKEASRTEKKASFSEICGMIRGKATDYSSCDIDAVIYTGK
ncbi:MAG: hypothetical protein V1708_02945 [Candidatus Micrarchaeota archaeon]